MNTRNKLGQPGTCPSSNYDRRRCQAPLVFAATTLPVRWTTGQVIYGEGPCADLDRPCFGATSAAECAEGHRVAGGHKAPVFQP